MARKSIAKKINEKCKKISVCPHCGASNGERYIECLTVPLPFLTPIFIIPFQIYIGSIPFQHYLNELFRSSEEVWTVEDPS